MVRIRGITYEVMELDLTLSQDERGDSARCRLQTTTEQDFEPYDYSAILLKGDTHYLVIESVTDKQLDTDLFEYIITFKDSLHAFDKIFPPDRKFTAFGGTPLGSMLNVYQRAGEETTGNLNFTYDTGDTFYDTLVPQKEYVNANLSSYLMDMFRVTRTRPRFDLSDVVPALSYRQYTARVGNTPLTDVNDWEYRENQIATSNYATEILGKVKNAIIEDGRGTWYPSKTGEVGIRTEEFRLDEVSAAYMLDDKVANVIQVIIKDGVTFNSIDYDVDITDWVLSKDEFDRLEDTTAANYIHPTNKRKANCVYYRIGGDRIENLWDTHPSRSDREHLWNAYQSACEKLASELVNPGLPTFRFDQPFEWYKILVRINYISIRDIDYVVEKVNAMNKTKSTMISNQSSSMVELVQHADALSLMAERMSQRVKVFRKSFDLDDTIYKLGNFTADDFVITTIKYTVIGDQVYIEGEAHKHYASVDAETGITREPYAFSITPKSVMTNIITKDYVEFSDVSRATDTFLSTDAQRALFNLFIKDAAYNKPIYDCEVIPQIPLFNVGGANATKSIHRPVLTFGGNSIVLHQRFNNQTIAGFTLDQTDSSFGDKKWQVSAIPYVNTLRKLDIYTINFGTNTGIDETLPVKSYPLVNRTSLSKTLGSGSNIQAEDVQVLLNENETLAHTHEIVFYADISDIVINGNIGKLNNLIKNYDSYPTLQLYKSVDEWHKFTANDKKPRSTDTLVTGGAITYNVNTRVLAVSGTESFTNWAIVADGEIVLANNSNLKTIYTNFRKTRRGLRAVVGA